MFCNWLNWSSRPLRWQSWRESKRLLRGLGFSDRSLNRHYRQEVEGGVGFDKRANMNLFFCWLSLSFCCAAALSLLQGFCLYKSAFIFTHHRVLITSNLFSPCLMQLFLYLIQIIHKQNTSLYFSSRLLEGTVVKIASRPPLNTKMKVLSLLSHPSLFQTKNSVKFSTH